MEKETIFNQEVAEKGLELTMPIINDWLKERKKVKGFAVVVAAGFRKQDELNEGIENYLLLEKTLGHSDEDISRYALGQARLSWRTRGDSNTIVKRYPELMRKGDCLYDGAIIHVIDDFSLVVSVSGGEKEHQNEYIARLILDSILYVVKDAVTKGGINVHMNFGFYHQQN
jgi:hypothetical protein